MKLSPTDVVIYQKSGIGKYSQKILSWLLDEAKTGDASVDNSLLLTLAKFWRTRDNALLGLLLLFLSRNDHNLTMLTQCLMHS